MKTDDKLLMELAEVIYRNNGGMTDECYEEVTGEPRKLFTKPPMVSVPPDVTYWVEPHEQDEYLWQASKVLEYLREKGLLNK